MTDLIPYDVACRALAEAKSIDDVKNIIDIAVAIKEYARRANNRKLEADCVELRLRASRQLKKLMDAQAETVGLATGGEHGGRTRLDGSRVNPSIVRPTLAMQGINKSLAQQARTLGALSDAAFEDKVAEARASATRVYARAVREVEIEQERQERRARTSVGGSVADLYALIASGYRAGAMSIDCPWPFENYSDRAAHAVTDHYDTMTIDEIKALPIAQLAAADCAIFAWVTWPRMPQWYPVLEAWGVTYSGLGFDWVKQNPSGEGLHMGNGRGTRQNPEPCLYARIGKPLRLDLGVHSVVMEPEVIVSPVRGHSVKPEAVRKRIEQLFGGPYLELFARRPAQNWTTWGNEIEAPEQERTKR